MSFSKAISKSNVLLSRTFGYDTNEYVNYDFSIKTRNPLDNGTNKHTITLTIIKS